MATEKQITANRANAQNCTGPTSEKGRATSSMNALKTGLDARSEIIEGWESSEERDALTAAWYARFPPADEEECYLLDTVIASEWLQRRYLSVEASLWKQQINCSSSKLPGGAFANVSQVFCRVDRRLNSAHRNHSSAMKQLHVLRAKRNADLIGDITQPEIAAAPNLTAPDIAALTLSGDRASSSREGALAGSRNPIELPAAETLSPCIATEPLNPELVSFRTFPNPAPPLPDPGASTLLPASPLANIQPDPALSDII
jgi:hypothetical protein